MKLEISKRTLTFALIGLVIVVILALIINRYRSRSKFEWPVTGTPAADDTQLTSDLQTLQDNYNIAMIAVNAMPTGTAAEIAAKNQAMLNAQKTLTTNINTKVQTYISGKCPEVTSGVAPAATDTAKTAAWTAYQSDLAKIQQSYYTVIGAATATSSPSSILVLAARKADISGATRKYIATVCPNFYYTSASDPTATYKQWTHVTSGTAPSVGLLGSDVTNANITTWASYAALTKSTNAELAVLPGATTIGSSTAPLTAADWTNFAVGDTVQFTYQTVDASGVATTSAPVKGTIATLVGTTGITITPTAPFTIPSSGLIVPSGTVVAKALVTSSTNWSKLDSSNVPNWKKARDAGPGTYPRPTWGTI